ncbi:MAG TPA: DUF4013 domain-containing protein [Methanospirillum sp.]|nr:DUF4013 domain-containing protein [Methanospirillum sp.]
MTSYEVILSDASEFVRRGLIEQWQRWITLILLMIIQGITIGIIPLFNGYVVRVYQSMEQSTPEINDYTRLFIDGWKFNIVTIIYLIPAIIVAVFLGIFSIIPIIAGFMGAGKINAVVGIIMGSIGLLLTGLIFAAISLILYMAYVHFSRSGNLTDAFQIGEIIAHISNGIGWEKYFMLWIIIWIFSMTFGVIIMGMNALPPMGIIAGMILAPLWALFIAKINVNIYDNKP